MIKVNKIGMKEDYDKNDSLRFVIRCIPTLAIVLSYNITGTFLMLADNMPGREKMPELQVYFEHTYIRGRRRLGRSGRHGSEIFPAERWNHFKTASEWIA